MSASFLTDVSSLEFDPSAVASSTGTITTPTGTYEYHLPHTKTIDLIGEEFAPRALGKGAPNVVVVSAMPISAGNVFTATSAGCSQLIQTMPQSVSTVSTASGLPLSVSLSSSDHQALLEQHQHLNLSTVTVDMPTIAAGNAAEENGGVLLCNLDELSRYIPENFYTDFNLSDTTSLEATTVSVPSSMTSVPMSTTQKMQPITTILQAAGQVTKFSISSKRQYSPTTTLHSPTVSSGPITIQFPTQPQPVQTMKTVTYVHAANNKPQQSITTSSFQPVLLKSTGFALTSNGEQIGIKGLANPNQTIQFHVKQAPGHQTFQLQGLHFDPTKMTIMQELPDVGKVVIQEDSRLHHDSISTILQEMKTEEANHAVDFFAGLAASGLEYATAIPVSVTSLKDPNKPCLKRMGPASTIVLPAAKKGSRNIIFAGNTLPHGAIPVQINGLSTLNALPISAVKSIPLPINLSTLTPTSAPVLTTGSLHQVVAARKTKVEVSPARGAQITSANLVNKVNNNSLKTSGSGLSKINQNLSTKPIGNNKTCNWQFENGEICGKTFSKSYNLVVHMRMHEDVRPFQCGLCDQTFRQKAHLQRHETTHGIGTKVNRTSSHSPKRRRKRSSRGGSSSVMSSPGTQVVQVSAPQHSSNLQERLARVSQQFGTKVKSKSEEEDEDDIEEGEEGVEGDDEEMYEEDGVLKSYVHKQRYSEAANTIEDEEALKQMAMADEENVTVTEIIELKDGEAFLAAATGQEGLITRAGSKLRPVTVKLERLNTMGQLILGTDIILQSESEIAVKNITGSEGDNIHVQVSEAELRDEDIIENIHVASGGSGTGSAASCLADAVSEAVGGTEMEQDDDDKVTEEQKDMLHAILIGDQESSSSDMHMPMQEEEEEEHMEKGEEEEFESQNGNVQVVSQPKEVSDFPPVSVQEFTLQNSN